MKISDYILLAWLALTVSVTTTGVLSGVAEMVCITSVIALIIQEV